MSIDSFLLLCTLAATLLVLVFAGLILIPFRKAIDSFLEKRRIASQKTDWEYGFISCMRHYYIEKMTILQIEDYYSEIPKEDLPYFFKGVDEAFKVIEAHNA